MRQLILPPHLLGKSSYRNRGSGDYLERTTSLPTRTNTTVCGWFVRRTDNNDNSTIFALTGADTIENWSIVTDTDGTTLGVSNGALISTFASSPAQDVPFFAALVGSASITGYWAAVNGSTFTSVNLAASNSSSATSFIFGQLGAIWFGGNYWNVRVWDAQLTVNELLGEMYSSVPRRLANLHAWWPLEGNLSQILFDYSGNNRHFARVGSGRIEPFFLPLSIIRPMFREWPLSAPVSGTAPVPRPNYEVMRRLLNF